MLRNTEKRLPSVREPSTSIVEDAVDVLGFIDTRGHAMLPKQTMMSALYEPVSYAPGSLVRRDLTCLLPHLLPLPIAARRRKIP